METRIQSLSDFTLEFWYMTRNNLPRIASSELCKEGYNKVMYKNSCRFCDGISVSLYIYGNTDGCLAYLPKHVIPLNNMWGHGFSVSPRVYRPLIANERGSAGSKGLTEVVQRIKI